MTVLTKALPQSWLAFDLNVLRRLDFHSIAIPLMGDPALGVYLKRRGTRVSTNDLARSDWTRSAAVIQNNLEVLTEDEVAAVLEDVYIPRYKLKNAALRNYFNETDSWWFDNVRQNLDRLQSPFKFSIAASLAMRVGDYSNSFIAESLEYRQPLSAVFRRLWSIFPAPVNNGQNNTSHNESTDDFIAESRADVMFLRLPATV
ncbi:MAG: hypothetical protein LC730_02555, partial [Acidobacteria bacterium]|nr:hypothetical protein [Acidobacteriota bacterium]